MLRATDHELVNEVLDDMDKELRAEEASYRDPKKALDTLVNATERWNSELFQGWAGAYNSEEEQPVRLPLPVEILEVIEVKLSGGFRRNETLIRARARRADGPVDVLEYWTWSDSGGREEPPDYDWNLFWENLDDGGYAIEWEHLYTIAFPAGSQHRDTPERKKKVQYLYEVIRKAGVRARIHNDRLEYNVKQRDDVYHALGKHLVDLSPGHNLFNETIFR